MFNDELLLEIARLEVEMDDQFYTVTQVAKMFDVTRQTIYNWIEQGRFPNIMEVGEGRGAVTIIPDSDVEVVKKEEADKLIEKLNRLGFQHATA